MKNYKCRYCESGTDNPLRICKYCEEKLVLHRQIRAMLMPYYLKKKEREKRNGNQR